MSYRIVFYRTPRGDSPFEMFLDGHNDKVRAKFKKLLQILKEHGPNLKRPYADVLRDGIRELRVGFIKKTHAVPSEEIERALRYKRDHEEREP